MGPAVLETARRIKPALPSPWHPAGSHPDRRQEERETDRVLSRKHKSPGEDQMAPRTGGERQQGRHCQAALLDEEIKLRARPAPEPENQTHLVGEGQVRVRNRGPLVIITHVTEIKSREHRLKFT